MSFRFRCRIWSGAPRFSSPVGELAALRKGSSAADGCLAFRNVSLDGGDHGRARRGGRSSRWLGAARGCRVPFLPTLGHGSRAHGCRDADVGPRLLAKYLFPSTAVPLSRFGTSQYEHAAAAGKYRDPVPWPRTNQQRDPTEGSRSPPALSSCTSIPIQPGTPHYVGCYRDPVTFPCA